MDKLNVLRSKIQATSGDGFIENILTFCNELEKEQILTFGFIVYDETTPEFRKILRDKDYWEALDRASGENMLVFALSDQKETEYEVDTRMHLMTSFSPSQPTKTKSYSHLLHKVFDKDSTLVYPSVLFFQVYQGSIYDIRLVPLKRGDTWNSMHQVQNLFESIATVLSNIAPENYGNRREIFEQVKNELLNQKYTMYILNGPKKISDFIGIVKNLLFFL